MVGNVDKTTQMLVMVVVGWRVNGSFETLSACGLYRAKKKLGGNNVNIIEIGAIPKHC